MSTYTLKSVARRSSIFGVAAALFVATLIPALASADALNPLTERSLLLTSSSPGYKFTDGSGNATYAPPGSGPNGQKTGQTFNFRVSSDYTSTPLLGFSLQYCTLAAGLCQAPGDNAGDARTPDRKTNAQALADGDETSDLEVVYTGAVQGSADTDDFQIYVNDVAVASSWTLATYNVEDDSFAGTARDDLTGKANYISLTSATGINPVPGDKITIVFNASDDNYITNPGSGAFFVKMNTYDTNDDALQVRNVPAFDANGDQNNPNIIDGGVTVANVMTDSIHIITKVLETMSFSVGTENRDTQELTNPDVHGTCDPILQIDDNRLFLGNPAAEYSLETGTAWDVFSYWRLSSNSSGGATVYYSGETLANTVGDIIEPIGPVQALSTPGTEQFGLGFVDAAAEVSQSFIDTRNANPTRYFDPTIAPLNMMDDYDDATGTITGANSTPGTAAFAFDRDSLLEPVVIAENDDQVISCATAKMRYVANIGADTPAGVYTTKINYLAAPQY